MKPSEFKQIIKESVKEAIQEELKDILLEAYVSAGCVTVAVPEKLESEGSSR